MNKKILFICWDGPQTNYLESLFFPIFQGLMGDDNYDFHVIQFSWAGKEKGEQLGALAKQMGIRYTHFPIKRKPHLILGTLATLVGGIAFIRRYIQLHRINILMPRSTMPGIMSRYLPLKSSNINLVFDADGLPLEERVDFNGLNPKGYQYRWLKNQETKILKRADLILTRSQKARQIHLKNIGFQFSRKIYKVGNGRDKTFFTPNAPQREMFRKKLGITQDQILLAYCGSLGPQYGLDIMLALFEALLYVQPNSRLLLVTPEDPYLENRIPNQLFQKVIPVHGPYSAVPSWLNAADLALAIREPRYSMQGVDPIKLGEYLLMGLPTIASRGIGDTEELLENKDFVYLFDHHNKEEIQLTMNWVTSRNLLNKESIRNFALQHFSLDKSIKDYKIALNTLAKTV